MARVSVRADAGGRWGGCSEGRGRQQEAHWPLSQSSREAGGGSGLEQRTERTGWV